MAEGQSPDATQVFEWLYGTENIPAKRATVRLSLTGIAENATPLEGEPRGGDTQPADVRVYCTHDRLREGNARANGEKRIFDTVSKEFLKAKFDCARAMAWTIIPGGRYDPNPDDLQFCPWFLDYAMKQNAQFQGQWKPGKIASMITSLKLDRIATSAVYAPVDLFQLFDKVIVHELSHTRRGGEFEDIGGYSGYGWKNCRKLSTEPEGDTSPRKNADTIALFASISALIRNGGMIHEDGTFVKGPDAGGGDEGNEVAKRSARILGDNGELKPFPEPPVVKNRTLQFNPSNLKGRPLF